VCAELGRLSNEIDALLYQTEGFGAPLPASLVDWNRVQTYLAPNFTWNDYSAVHINNQLFTIIIMFMLMCNTNHSSARGATTATTEPIGRP
jgi:hypothetical protein